MSHVKRRQKLFTRRDFLRLVASGAGAATLSSLGGLNIALGVNGAAGGGHERGRIPRLYPHIGIGPGGSAGDPRPVINENLLRNLRFDFGEPFNSQLADMTEVSDKEVVVYLLDSIPAKSQIENATQRWPMLKPYYGKILDAKLGLSEADIYQTELAFYHYSKDVGSDLSVFNSPNAQPDYLNDFEKGNPTEDPDIVGELRYDSSDHGLFNASLIHMIAPQVKIHVLEVIGKTGVGTFASYTAGFLKIVELHQRLHPNASAIINCGFTMALPTNGHNGSDLNQRLQDYELLHDGIKPQIDGLLEAINQTINVIDAKIIAAAGNDSDRLNKGKLPKDGAMEARYPAQFEGVIGVGALQRDLAHAASYSNKPDQPVNEGFMVFGGDYQDDAQPLPETGDYADSGSGVIGLYTGNLNINTLAPSGQFINPYGFAEWKGTSMATAIFAGAVAQLCEVQHIEPNRAVELIRENSTIIDSLREFKGILQTHG